MVIKLLEWSLGWVLHSLMRVLARYHIQKSWTEDKLVYWNLSYFWFKLIDL